MCLVATINTHTSLNFSIPQELPKPKPKGAVMTGFTEMFSLLS